MGVVVKDYLSGVISHLQPQLQHEVRGSLLDQDRPWATQFDMGWREFLGWSGGSRDRGAFSEARRPGFDPRDLHGRRRALTLK